MLCALFSGNRNIERKRSESKETSFAFCFMQNLFEANHKSFVEYGIYGNVILSRSRIVVFSQCRFKLLWIHWIHQLPASPLKLLHLTANRILPDIILTILMILTRISVNFGNSQIYRDNLTITLDFSVFDNNLINFNPIFSMK